MRKIRGRAIMLVSASLLLLSCTDGQSPSDLYVGPTAMLALALAPGSANLTQGDPLPINRIRVTVLRVPDNSVVTVYEEDVTPSAEFWDLAVEIPLPDSGILRVRLRIELINVTIIGGQEVETVEFSALTDGIDLIVGQTPALTTVTVERGPADNLAVTSLTILPAGPVIEGDDVQLEASVTTNDPSANPRLFWTSLDEALATVDDNGLVLALLPGEVEIVVTAGSQSGSLLLGILPRVTGISLSPTNLVLEYVGAEGSFTATVTDPRGDPIETPVEWTVGDPTVLEDLGDGSFRALAPGSATVTATVVSDPAVSTSGTVLVELVPNSVSVTPEEVTLTALGQQVQFTAAVRDVEGGVIASAPVEWRSSDQTVALVNESGLMTAVGPGAATIFADVETGRSASAGSGEAQSVVISGSASVVVTQTVTTVAVSPATLALDLLSVTEFLTATAFDAGGSPIVGAGFQWTTSSNAVATVTQQGAVTARGPGTATITATTDGVSGSATVTVTVSQPENFTFATAGNTQLRGGAFPLPSTPTAKVPGLLANTPGLTVTTLGPFATDAGGLVTIEPDGDFLYTPPLGSNTADSFEYTVANGATGSVIINILDMVWYIDNLAGLGNGTGASNDPFGSFGEPGLDTGLAPGHTVFIHTGDGTTLNYDGDVTLDDNQKVLGEGVGLTIAGVGMLVPAGVAPKITNTLGDAVTVANGNTVSGINIDGPSGAGIQGVEISGLTVDQVDILNTGTEGVLLQFTGGVMSLSGVNVKNSGTRGVSLVGVSGTVTFDDLSVSGAADDAFFVSGGSPTLVVNVGTGGISNTTAFRRVLNILNTTGGTVTFNGGSITDNGGTGLDIFNTLGAITVNTPVVLTNTTDSGVDIINASGPVTFADVDVTIPLLAVGPSAPLGPSIGPAENGARTSLGGSTAGVSISSATGTITFGTLNSSTGDEATLEIFNSGTVRVTDPASTLSASAYLAIDVSSSDLDMTFASVSSSDSPIQGIRLNNTTGTLTMNGGSIGTALGVGVLIAGGSADVTYAGTLTADPSSSSVDIQNNTGGTLTFGGPIAQVCDTCAFTPGINLVNNAGTTINFSGGLSLNTDSNTGFSATGGGTVNVTGTNTVTSTFGTGVSIQNTTIGGSGVTFQSVSVNGAPNGIVLANTGSGSFTVTGTGAPDSGGLIQNTAGDGIDINGGSGTYTFTRLNIDQSSFSGINLSGTSGTFALQNSTVTNSGTTFSSAGVNLVDHVGSAVISNSTVSASNGDNVFVLNDLGPLSLTFTGSTFDSSGGDSAIGVFIEAGTSALVTATLTGNTFSNNYTGLDGFSSGTSTLNLTVGGAGSGNSFTSNTNGVVLGNSGGGNVTFDVIENTFTGNSFSGVDLSGSGPGLLSGSITGNTTSGGPLLSRGVEMSFDAGSDAIVRTSGNNISGGSYGVRVTLGTATSDNSTLDLTIDTEIIVLDGSSTTPGIDVTADQATTLCTNIRSNTITVGDANFIELRQFGTSTVSVEGLNGGTGSVSLGSDVADFLETANPAGSNFAFVDITTSILGVPTGTCRVP
jgi:uncharacterized protein YjdB